LGRLIDISRNFPVPKKNDCLFITITNHHLSSKQNKMNQTESKDEDETKMVPLPNWLVNYGLEPIQEIGLVRLLNDLKQNKAPQELFAKALNGHYSDFQDDNAEIDGITELISDLKENGLELLVENVTKGKYDHGFVLKEGENYEQKMDEQGEWVKEMLGNDEQGEILKKMLGLDLKKTDQNKETSDKKKKKKKKKKKSNCKKTQEQSNENQNPQVVNVNVYVKPMDIIMSTFNKLLELKEKMFELCQNKAKAGEERGLVASISNATQIKEIQTVGIKYFNRKEAIERFANGFEPIEKDLNKTFDIYDPSKEIILLVALNLPDGVNSEMYYNIVKIK
jgi:hypothetical protein